MRHKCIYSQCSCIYVRMSDNNTFLLIRYPEISSDPDPDHQRADGDHDDTDGDTRGDTRPGHWWSPTLWQWQGMQVRRSGRCSHSWLSPKWSAKTVRVSYWPGSLVINDASSRIFLCHKSLLEKFAEILKCTMIILREVCEKSSQKYKNVHFIIHFIHTIILRDVSRNTCALIMMTRSPGCISARPAVRVTISPGSGIYAGLSHSISYNPWSSSAPSSNMSPGRCHKSQPEKTFILPASHLPASRSDTFSLNPPTAVTLFVFFSPKKIECTFVAVNSYICCWRRETKFLEKNTPSSANSILIH